MHRSLKKMVRYFKPIRSRYFKRYKSYFKNCSGIEIGGPSRMFARKGRLPVYAVAKSIDNCNFGSTTVWEGEIDKGRTFVFAPHKKPGLQYISEASDLNGISSQVYDFVVSSHCIEHLANPIKALIEWRRILKQNGVLLLIVPHRNASFDHKRDVTNFEHIISDFKNDTNESDLTHLSEILEKHDFERDTGSGGFNEFKERGEHNVVNRCLHHHVFDCDLVRRMVQYSGFEIMDEEMFFGVHIVIFAKKSAVVSDYALGRVV
jgi:SAM-dependent methyltransferase